MRKAIAYLLLAVVLISAGCIGTLSEHLTPMKNDKEVIDYVVEAGTGRVEDYKGLLFPSLATLRKLKHDFEAAVALTNQELKQIAEKKQLKDSILRGIVDHDVDIGEQRHEALFDPVTGAVAIGLSLFGIAGGGYLGLMRKRPQDITPQEFEKALGEIKGEVTEKDRKIIQLVASVKNVIDAQPTKKAKEEIKKILKNSQLPDVRATVKEALTKI
jgi:hypothetical protein